MSERERLPSQAFFLVASDYRAAESPTLTAEQKALVFRNGEVRIESASGLSPSAWEVHQLTYKNESPSVIAAEFNRFNALKFVVADPELAKARCSGVFDAHDPKTFIAFLELSAGVRVERPRDGQVFLTMANYRDGQ